MYKGFRVAAIVPALNEEASVGAVVRAVPAWIDETIVVDNGSTDGTGAAARAAGARVVDEPRRGYGAACAAGVAAAGDADVVVFMDADGADRPEEAARLMEPIARGEADLVVGSRVLGVREPGALGVVQRAGNVVASVLLRLLFGLRATDLGPFRAIRRDVLESLRMDDRAYGWTVQMQARAAARGDAVVEVPVSYRRRIGVSKISGTLRGVVGASVGILVTLWRERLRRPPFGRPPARRLIVLTRYPVPGTAKTRLIPTLGANGAAELQRRMTRATLAEADRLEGRREVGVDVYFEGGSAAEMRASFGPRRYVPQREGDLGDRLRGAFAAAFERGARAVVVVGSDCPALDSTGIEDAFDALRRNDAVIGPAADGGYYLIGLRASAPLFDDMPWSSSGLLGATLRRARELGLSAALLPELSDVDTAADLPSTETEREPAHPVGPLISVVVPALNESAYVGAAVASALREANVEVVVADGGSTDDTAAVAFRAGARVVRAPRGRGAQMNAGAAAARGEFLVFLHADTTLPDGFAAEVRSILRRDGSALGAFRLRVDAPGVLFRALEWTVLRRSTLLRSPYGDQALFVRAGLFRAVGGFREWPLMEDFEFVRRVARIGCVTTAKRTVLTSARRWAERGLAATTLINQACVAAYLFGVSPERLASFRTGRGARRNDRRRETCAHKAQNRDRAESQGGC